MDSYHRPLTVTETSDFLFVSLVNLSSLAQRLCEPNREKTQLAVGAATKHNFEYLPRPSYRCMPYAQHMRSHSQAPPTDTLASDGFLPAKTCNAKLKLIPMHLSLLRRMHELSNANRLDLMITNWPVPNNLHAISRSRHMHDAPSGPHPKRTSPEEE